MNVKIAGIEFDNVFYDGDRDVLYLHVGDPGTAVDFDGSPEGHHIRYGPDGAIVGLTILNAKLLLAEDGEIVVTLPEQTIRMSDLSDVLAAA